MIETLRHKAKGETRIWTGISLVSLLLPKKHDDKTPQNRLNCFFVEKDNMFSKRFFLHFCFVSSRSSALQIVESMCGSKHPDDLLPVSPMNLHLRCKRSATFLYRPYIPCLRVGIGSS